MLVSIMNEPNEPNEPSRRASKPFSPLTNEPSYAGSARLVRLGSSMLVSVGRVSSVAVRSALVASNVLSGRTGTNPSGIASPDGSDGR